MLAIEGRKGLPPIEGFFLARQFMYQQVYHHKAMRAADSLIRAIFMRVAELVRGGLRRFANPDGAARGRHRRRASSWATISPLDDIQLLSCFRNWETGRDPLLAQLTTSLARRDLPKTVPLKPDGASGAWREAVVARERSRAAARLSSRPRRCARRSLGRALR